MSARILILWPDTASAAALQQALQQAAPHLRLEAIGRHPTSEELDQISPIGLGGAIVGLSDGEVDGLRVLRDLHTRFPAVPVAAASAHESADALLAVMRAGAIDFLWPPFDADKLHNLLARIPDQADSTSCGHLLGVVPCQAADGASTVALHAANFIRKQTDRTTLLLDCDFDSSVMAFRLGIKDGFSLLDALSRVEDLDDLWNSVASDWKSLQVLACPFSGDLIADPHRTRLAQAALSALRNFDYVVADLPAAIQPSGYEVLKQAAAVVLVCTPDLVSVHLARRRLRQLASAGVEQERVKLAVNRYDARNAIPAEAITEAVGIAPSFFLPNAYEAVTQAEMKGMLVAKDSAVGCAIEQMAMQLIGREPKPTGRNSNWTRLLSLRT